MLPKSAPRAPQELPEPLQSASGSSSGPQFQDSGFQFASNLHFVHFPCKNTTFEGGTYLTPSPSPSPMLERKVYRHAETWGRRIQRARGHMRRPLKRDRNPTSPSPQTQNASRAEKFKLQIPILNFNPQKPNSQLKTQTDVSLPLRDENSKDDQGYTVTG